MTGERLQLQVIFSVTGRIVAATADPWIACRGATWCLVLMTMPLGSPIGIINTPLSSSGHIEQLPAR